ncbi:hypothetical protein JTB14_008138 [Gonioctena quinquepunctata]|nr:hypothetical protein JTB14_008138 [Gonioctena quinquepunctata]
MGDCFICKKPLIDDVYVAKKRTVQTLLAASVTRGRVEHQQMLQNIDSLCDNVARVEILFNDDHDDDDDYNFSTVTTSFPAIEEVSRLEESTEEEQPGPSERRKTIYTPKDLENQEDIGSNLQEKPQSAPGTPIQIETRELQRLITKPPEPSAKNPHQKINTPTQLVGKFPKETCGKKISCFLFDHPNESILNTKGPQNAQFDVHKEYLNKAYRKFGPQIAKKFGIDASEIIPVAKISLPPLGEILKLGREENFSLFIPKHQRLAATLLDIFLGMENTDDLLAMAIYARERVNPLLFNYSFSVALLNRPDTSDLDIPSLVHFFQSRPPIELPLEYTASALEEEQHLAYFREDLGVNLHHWHWHLVYPTSGPMKVVNKNRRGELFYYMHQQIVARYNFERLSNRMKRVERFTSYEEPIKEAYFPKLDCLVAGRWWSARVANQRMQNLNREDEQLVLNIEDMKNWRNRIYDAIHRGSVIGDDGTTIPLTENEGIDILGNIVESSDLSVDKTFYGNLHNMGHNIVAFIQDPEDKYLESSGVIGEPSTAMRDPWFYRWHAFIDDIFQEFKSSLPGYPDSQLNFPGIIVRNIQVQTQGGPMNEFQTSFQQSEVDISPGMEFQPRGAIQVRFTHLNHSPYTYTITVDNKSESNRVGTCRIFLAPKYDERHKPWLFIYQKNMFIELDKFKVTLIPGSNTITRASTQSSVTIPFERIFRSLRKRPEGGESLERSSFCGCGWPQYMLIPKGDTDPFACQLFVMISDYSGDEIQQTTEGQCKDAASYCGIKDKLYPDRRAMGYPFDRRPLKEGVDKLEQFLTPNMGVQDVNIRFTKGTVP